MFILSRAGISQNGIEHEGVGTRSPEYRRLLKRLKQARMDAGLTQADVARKLGKPQSFVSKSESGERRLDAVELKRMADILGTQLARLLEDP